MTENDWDILARWNSDPEILYFSEGADVESYDLEEVQGIYRWVSQNALCFIIEFNDQPIGECWLQRMNIERLLEKYPDKDCRRIDLMIGEKRLWGRGLGIDTIRTLTKFGLEEEGADMPFPRRDTVSEFAKQTTYAFHSTEFKDLTRLRLNQQSFAEPETSCLLASLTRCIHRSSTSMLQRILRINGRPDSSSKPSRKTGAPRYLQYPFMAFQAS